MYIQADGFNILKYPLGRAEIVATLQRDNTSVGKKVTDFTEYGYFQVLETEKPTGVVVTELDPVNMNGAWTQQWETREFTEDETTTILNSKKQKVVNQLAAKRFSVETNHPTIDTSRSSQAMINGAWSACQVDPTRVIDFKGKDGWVQLTSDDVAVIATTVADWVQSCFTNEKTLQEQLEACTTVEQLEAVDIETGWPT